VTGGPLIVQSDKTLLLEIDHDLATACRRAIAPFAELERSPEHVHTYRLTPLGLWNARAAGHDAEQVVDTLLSTAAIRFPTACWSTSQKPWRATADCAWRSTPFTSSC
jgi:DNA excision repair protein ERCC-3